MALVLSVIEAGALVRGDVSDCGPGGVRRQIEVVSPVAGHPENMTVRFTDASAQLLRADAFVNRWR